MSALLQRAAIAIALCGAAVPAYADDVLYKCVDGKGAVSIQSSPCPKTSREVWKRDTAAMAAAVGSAPAQAPVTAPPIRAGQPPRPPGDAAHAGPPGAPPPPRPAPPNERSLAPASVESLAPIQPASPAPPPVPDPCDHAKDLAAQLRDMSWLELSNDQQQRLLSWVIEQCRLQSPSQ